jgi:ribosomal protein S18 acetylase RimI-like enzyme
VPADVALVLVHAVNPWGFAWLRRMNEDNVDLNRNFLDPGAAPPDNPDYDRLYDVLNPTTMDETAAAAVLGAIRALERTHGLAAAYRALSGGQFRHPHGVQYGGVEPTWSNRTLRAVWARHTGRAEATAFVDLHSGLGPRGAGVVYQTAPEASPEARLAASWWPDVLRAEPASAATAGMATGLIGPAFTAAHPGIPAVGVVLEFGTLPMHEVMLAALYDNWLEHHGRRDSDVGRAIEQRMRDAFLVDAPDWREEVCRRADEVVGRALEGIVAVAPVAASTPEPRIRDARPEDAGVLVDFAVAMAKETEGHLLSPEVVRAGVGSLLADPARGRVVVVEVEGRVVAALMLTLEWSDWRNGWFWWIQSVYVRPEDRRRGHYRRLHDHVRALAAREPDVCGLRVYVERDNLPARATYERLGMRETAYRMYEERPAPGKAGGR